MTPLWSVVVPTLDRPAELRRCLEALQGATLPRGHVEVLVVDDGGRQPAADVVAAVGGAIPMTVHRQANRGPAAARNAGAAEASGRWLAFTDDDCRPAPGWLPALQPALEQAPDALVGGVTVNALRDDLWAAASQLVVDHVVEQTPGGFLPSCNLAVERSRFVAAGGFDERFPGAAGEDRALCDSWRAAGRPVVHVPDAVVQHEHALSATRFWRQHAGYGAAAYAVHRAPGGSRPGAAGAYLRLLRRPFDQEPPRRALAVAGCLALSQAATAWGYAGAAARARNPQTTSAIRSPARPSQSGGPSPS